MGEYPAGRGDGRLSTSLDAFFTQYYERNPVTATFTGVHTYDHLLPEWSTAARTRERGELQALRDRLEEEWPAGASPSLFASAPTHLDAELARANIDVRIAEIESGFFQQRNPALWTGEAIFGLVSLMIRDFAPARARAESLRRRLSAIPEFLRSMRTVVAGPVPALWKSRAQKECAAAVELLDVGLLEWSRSSGLERLLTAEDTEVTEARREFVELSTWLDSVRDSDDAAMAAGETLVELLLRRGHFCHEPPRALLARAEQAMTDAQARLRVALEPFGGDWLSAQAAMAADRPTVDAYYATFSARWNDVRAAARAADVVTWLEWPIRYVPIPAWARAVQPRLYWLFYRSPAPFDRYSEYEYVVSPVDATMSVAEQEQRLRAWNHSVITLNHVVHHGGIGHHVQNWHASHRSSSRIGTVAAVDAASRIGMFLGGSMAEGWACYATQLVEELGVLSPLERISEQHTRVRLLARAIVDLRLHLGDWRFDACVDFYQSVVGMSPDVAQAEATKNSMFPCTALMYWLGTSTILDARERLRQSHGDAFSLKLFHDALLSRGAIPVPLAAALVQAELSA